VLWLTCEVALKMPTCHGWSVHLHNSVVTVSQMFAYVDRQLHVTCTRTSNSRSDIEICCNNNANGLWYITAQCWIVHKTLKHWNNNIHYSTLQNQIGWFGLRVGCHPALSLHSSNEPGELLQWLCINIVVVIIIRPYYYHRAPVTKN